MCRNCGQIVAHTFGALLRLAGSQTQKPNDIRHSYEILFENWLPSYGHFAPFCASCSKWAVIGFGVPMINGHSAGRTKTWQKVEKFFIYFFLSVILCWSRVVAGIVIIWDFRVNYSSIMFIGWNRKFGFGFWHQRRRFPNGGFHTKVSIVLIVVSWHFWEFMKLKLCFYNKVWRFNTQRLGVVEFILKFVIYLSQLTVYLPIRNRFQLVCPSGNYSISATIDA